MAAANKRVRADRAYIIMDVLLNLMIDSRIDDDDGEEDECEV